MWDDYDDGEQSARRRRQPLTLTKQANGFQQQLGFSLAGTLATSPLVIIGARARACCCRRRLWKFASSQGLPSAEAALESCLARYTVAERGRASIRSKVAITACRDYVTFSSVRKCAKPQQWQQQQRQQTPEAIHQASQPGWVL